MSKRPSIDLDAITASVATAMPEARQRTQAPKTQTKTENLEALAFKVSPEFRKRFKQHALAADMKLNELLFAALGAWERENSLFKEKNI